MAVGKGPSYSLRRKARPQFEPGKDGFEAELVEDKTLLVDNLYTMISYYLKHQISVSYNSKSFTSNSLRERERERGFK